MRKKKKKNGEIKRKKKWEGEKEREIGQYGGGSYITVIIHIQPYKIYPIWISCCLPNLGGLLIQNIRWK